MRCCAHHRRSPQSCLACGPHSRADRLGILNSLAAVDDATVLAILLVGGHRARPVFSSRDELCGLPRHADLGRDPHVSRESTAAQCVTMTLWVRSEGTKNRASHIDTRFPLTAQRAAWKGDSAMREIVVQIMSLCIHASCAIVFLFVMWWLLLDWCEHQDAMRKQERQIHNEFKN